MDFGLKFLAFLLAGLCLGLTMPASAAEPWAEYDRDMMACVDQTSPGYVDMYRKMAEGGEKQPMPQLSVDSIAGCMASKGYKPSSLSDFSMYQAFVSEALENPDPDSIERLKTKYKIGPAPQAKTRAPVSAIVPEAALPRSKVYVFPNGKQSGDNPDTKPQSPIYIPQ